MSSYAEVGATGIYEGFLATDTGELTLGRTFSGIWNPSFLVIHPVGGWLYAVSETSQHAEGRAGEVWALAPGESGDTIRELNHRSSGGDWPCHLTIAGSGRWLIVSNYQSGSLAVFALQSDGSLGEMTDCVQHHGSGPRADRQEGPHVHSTLFTPDQRFLLAADLGSDLLAMYTFDEETGRLRLHAYVSTPPGSGPRHMVFHPAGQILYLSQELNNTVAVYHYDAQQGTLELQQTLATLPPGHEDSLVAHIHLSPAGERLYVSNRGQNTLTTFAIAPDGQLVAGSWARCGGDWPRHFAVAPGGRFLLVANQKSGDVAVLPLQSTGGIPGIPDLAEMRVNIPGAACVQFASDPR
jgi:6-phosphogluconolactonase